MLAASLVDLRRMPLAPDSSERRHRLHGPRRPAGHHRGRALVFAAPRALGDCPGPCEGWRCTRAQALPWPCAWPVTGAKRSTAGWSACCCGFTSWKPWSGPLRPRRVALCAWAELCLVLVVFALSVRHIRRAFLGTNAGDPMPHPRLADQRCRRRPEDSGGFSPADARKSADGPCPTACDASAFGAWFTRQLPRHSAETARARPSATHCFRPSPSGPQRPNRIPEPTHDRHDRLAGDSSGA